MRAVSIAGGVADHRAGEAGALSQLPSVSHCATARRAARGANLEEYRDQGGISFAFARRMFTARLFTVAALALAACDDTGKAIKQEVKEIDEQEMKRDLKDGAAAIGSAAKEVGQEASKAIDKVDKKVAEEIRKD